MTSGIDFLCAGIYQLRQPQQYIVTDQIGTSHRVRSTPSLSGAVTSRQLKTGDIVIVTQIQQQSKNEVWYKIGCDQWTLSKNKNTVYVTVIPPSTDAASTTSSRGAYVTGSMHTEMITLWTSSKGGEEAKNGVNDMHSMIAPTPMIRPVFCFDHSAMTLGELPFKPCPMCTVPNSSLSSTCDMCGSRLKKSNISGKLALYEKVKAFRHGTLNIDTEGLHIKHLNLSPAKVLDHSDLPPIPDHDTDDDDFNSSSSGGSDYCSSDDDRKNQEEEEAAGERKTPTWASPSPRSRSSTKINDVGCLEAVELLCQRKTLNRNEKMLQSKMLEKMNNWNDGDGEMKTTGGSHLKNNNGGMGQKHEQEKNCHNRSGHQKVEMNWAGLWCAPGALVNIVAPIQKGLDPTHQVHNLLENCRGSRCRVVVNPYNTFQVGNLNGVTIQSNLGDRVHIPQCCFLRSTLPLHTLTKKNKKTFLQQFKKQSIQVLPPSVKPGWSVKPPTCKKPCNPFGLNRVLVCKPSIAVGLLIENNNGELVVTGRTSYNSQADASYENLVVTHLNDLELFGVTSGSMKEVREKKCLYFTGMEMKYHLDSRFEESSRVVEPVGEAQSAGSIKEDVFSNMVSKIREEGKPFTLSFNKPGWVYQTLELRKDRLNPKALFHDVDDPYFIDSASSSSLEEKNNLTWTLLLNDENDDDSTEFPEMYPVVPHKCTVVIERTNIHIELDHIYLEPWSPPVYREYFTNNSNYDANFDLRYRTPKDQAINDLDRNDDVRCAQRLEIGLCVGDAHKNYTSRHKDYAEEENIQCGKFFYLNGRNVSKLKPIHDRITGRLLEQIPIQTSMPLHRSKDRQKNLLPTVNYCVNTDNLTSKNRASLNNGTNQNKIQTIYRENIRLGSTIMNWSSGFASQRKILFMSPHSSASVHETVIKKLFDDSNKLVSSTTLNNSSNGIGKKNSSLACVVTVIRRREHLGVSLWAVQTGRDSDWSEELDDEETNEETHEANLTFCDFITVPVVVGHNGSATNKSNEKTKVLTLWDMESGTFLLVNSTNCCSIVHKYQLDWNSEPPQFVEMTPMNIDAKIVDATIISQDDYTIDHHFDGNGNSKKMMYPTSCLLLSDAGEIHHFWMAGRCCPAPDEKLHVTTFPTQFLGKSFAGITTVRHGNGAFLVWKIDGTILRIQKPPNWMPVHFDVLRRFILDDEPLPIGIKETNPIMDSVPINPSTLVGTKKGLNELRQSLHRDKLVVAECISETTKYITKHDNVVSAVHVSSTTRLCQKNDGWHRIELSGSGTNVVLDSTSLYYDASVGRKASLASNNSSKLNNEPLTWTKMIQRLKPTDSMSTTNGCAPIKHKLHLCLDKPAVLWELKISLSNPNSAVCSSPDRIEIEINGKTMLLNKNILHFRPLENGTVGRATVGLKGVSASSVTITIYFNEQKNGVTRPIVVMSLHGRGNDESVQETINLYNERLNKPKEIFQSLAIEIKKEPVVFDFNKIMTILDMLRLYLEDDCSFLDCIRLVNLQGPKDDIWNFLVVTMISTHDSILTTRIEFFLVWTLERVVNALKNKWINENEEKMLKLVLTTLEASLNAGITLLLQLLQQMVPCVTPHGVRALVSMLSHPMLLQVQSHVDTCVETLFDCSQQLSNCSPPLQSSIQSFKKIAFNMHPMALFAGRSHVLNMRQLQNTKDDNDAKEKKTEQADDEETKKKKIFQQKLTLVSEHFRPDSRATDSDGFVKKFEEDGSRQSWLVQFQRPLTLDTCEMELELNVSRTTKQEGSFRGCCATVFVECLFLVPGKVSKFEFQKPTNLNASDVSVSFQEEESDDTVYNDVQLCELCNRNEEDSYYDNYEEYLMEEEATQKWKEIFTPSKCVHHQQQQQVVHDFGQSVRKHEDSHLYDASASRLVGGHFFPVGSMAVATSTNPLDPKSLHNIKFTALDVRSMLVQHNLQDRLITHMRVTVRFHSKTNHNSGTCAAPVPLEKIVPFDIYQQEWRLRKLKQKQEKKGETKQQATKTDEKKKEEELEEEQEKMKMHELWVEMCASPADTFRVQQRQNRVSFNIYEEMAKKLNDGNTTKAEFLSRDDVAASSVTKTWTIVWPSGLNVRTGIGISSTPTRTMKFKESFTTTGTCQPFQGHSRVQLTNELGDITGEWTSIMNNNTGDVYAALKKTSILKTPLQKTLNLRSTRVLARSSEPYRSCHVTIHLVCLGNDDDPIPSLCSNLSHDSIRFLLHKRHQLRDELNKLNQLSSSLLKLTAAVPTCLVDEAANSSIGSLEDLSNQEHWNHVLTSMEWNVDPTTAANDKWNKDRSGLVKTANENGVALDSMSWGRPTLTYQSNAHVMRRYVKSLSKEFSAKFKNESPDYFKNIALLKSNQLKVDRVKRRLRRIRTHLSCLGNTREELEEFEELEELEEQQQQQQNVLSYFQTKYSCVQFCCDELLKYIDGRLGIVKLGCNSSLNATTCQQMFDSLCLRNGMSTLMEERTKRLVLHIMKISDDVKNGFNLVELIPCNNNGHHPLHLTSALQHTSEIILGRVELLRQKKDGDAIVQASVVQSLKSLLKPIQRSQVSRESFKWVLVMVMKISSALDNNTHVAKTAKTKDNELVEKQIHETFSKSSVQDITIADYKAKEQHNGTKCSMTGISPIVGNVYVCVTSVTNCMICEEAYLMGAFNDHLFVRVPPTMVALLSTLSTWSSLMFTQPTTTVPVPQSLHNHDNATGICRYTRQVLSKSFLLQLRSCMLQKLSNGAGSSSTASSTSSTSSASSTSSRGCFRDDMHNQQTILLSNNQQTIENLKSGSNWITGIVKWPFEAEETNNNSHGQDGVEDDVVSCDMVINKVNSSGHFFIGITEGGDKFTSPLRYLGQSNSTNKIHAYGFYPYSRKLYFRDTGSPSGSSKSYGCTIKSGDVVTISINFTKDELSFAAKGKSLGVAKKGGLRGKTWYPGVSLYNKKDKVTFKPGKEGRKRMNRVMLPSSRGANEIHTGVRCCGINCSNGQHGFIHGLRFIELKAAESTSNESQQSMKFKNYCENCVPTTSTALVVPSALSPCLTYPTLSKFRTLMSCFDHSRGTSAAAASAENELGETKNNESGKVGKQTTATESVTSKQQKVSDAVPVKRTRRNSVKDRVLEIERRESLHINTTLSSPARKKDVNATDDEQQQAKEDSSAEILLRALFELLLTSSSTAENNSDYSSLIVDAIEHVITQLPSHSILETLQTNGHQVIKHFLQRVVDTTKNGVSSNGCELFTPSEKNASQRIVRILLRRWCYEMYAMNHPSSSSLPIFMARLALKLLQTLSPSSQKQIEDQKSTSSSCTGQETWQYMFLMKTAMACSTVYMSQKEQLSFITFPQDRLLEQQFLQDTFDANDSLSVEVLMSRNHLINLRVPFGRTATVAMIKHRLWQKTGISISQQVLRVVIPYKPTFDTSTFVGTVLHDSWTLHEAYCLQRETEQKHLSMYGRATSATSSGLDNSKNALSVKCKNGHVLVKYTTTGGSCDVCHKNKVAGTGVMDCRTCNYWLCNACCVKAGESLKSAAKLDTGTSSGASSAGSPEKADVASVVTLDPSALTLSLTLQNETQDVALVQDSDPNVVASDPNVVAFMRQTGCTSIHAAQRCLLVAHNKTSAAVQLWWQSPHDYMRFSAKHIETSGSSNGSGSRLDTPFDMEHAIAIGIDKRKGSITSKLVKFPDGPIHVVSKKFLNDGINGANCVDSMSWDFSVTGNKAWVVGIVPENALMTKDFFRQKIFSEVIVGMNCGVSASRFCADCLKKTHSDLHNKLLRVEIDSKTKKFRMHDMTVGLEVVSQSIPQALFDRGEKLHLAFCGHNGTILTIKEFSSSKVNNPSIQLPKVDNLVVNRSNYHWNEVVGEISSKIKLTMSPKVLVQCGAVKKFINSDQTMLTFLLEMANNCMHHKKKPISKANFLTELNNHCQVYINTFRGPLLHWKDHYIASPKKDEVSLKLFFSSKLDTCTFESASILLVAPYAQRITWGWERAAALQKLEGTVSPTLSRELKQIDVLPFEKLLDALYVGCQLIDPTLIIHTSKENSETTVCTTVTGTATAIVENQTKEHQPFRTNVLDILQDEPVIDTNAAATDAEEKVQTTTGTSTDSTVQKTLDYEVKELIAPPQDVILSASTALCLPILWRAMRDLVVHHNTSNNSNNNSSQKTSTTNEGKVETTDQQQQPDLPLLLCKCLNAMLRCTLFSDKRVIYIVAADMNQTIVSLCEHKQRGGIHTVLKSIVGTLVQHTTVMASPWMQQMMIDMMEGMKHTRIQLYAKDWGKEEGKMSRMHIHDVWNLLRFVHHVISNETKTKQQKRRKNIESNVTLNFAMKVLRFSVDIMMLEENAAYQMIFLEQLLESHIARSLLLWMNAFEAKKIVAKKEETSSETNAIETKLQVGGETKDEKNKTSPKKEEVWSNEKFNAFLSTSEYLNDEDDIVDTVDEICYELVDGTYSGEEFCDILQDSLDSLCNENRNIIASCQAIVSCYISQCEDIDQIAEDCGDHWEDSDSAERFRYVVTNYLEMLSDSDVYNILKMAEYKVLHLDPVPDSLADWYLEEEEETEERYLHLIRCQRNAAKKFMALLKATPRYSKLLANEQSSDGQTGTSTLGPPQKPLSPVDVIGSMLLDLFQHFLRLESNSSLSISSSLLLDVIMDVIITDETPSRVTYLNRLRQSMLFSDTSERVCSQLLTRIQTMIRHKSSEIQQQEEQEEQELEQFQQKQKQFQMQSESKNGLPSSTISSMNAASSSGSTTESTPLLRRSPHIDVTSKCWVVVPSPQQQSSSSLSLNTSLSTTSIMTMNRCLIKQDFMSMEIVLNNCLGSQNSISNGSSAGLVEHASTKGETKGESKTKAKTTAVKTIDFEGGWTCTWEGGSSKEMDVCNNAWDMHGAHYQINVDNNPASFTWADGTLQTLVSDVVSNMVRRVVWNANNSLITWTRNVSFSDVFFCDYCGEFEGDYMTVKNHENTTCAVLQQKQKDLQGGSSHSGKKIRNQFEFTVATNQLVEVSEIQLKFRLSTATVDKLAVPYQVASPVHGSISFMVGTSPDQCDTTIHCAEIQAFTVKNKLTSLVEMPELPVLTRYVRVVLELDDTIFVDCLLLSKFALYKLGAVIKEEQQHPETSLKAKEVSTAGHGETKKGDKSDGGSTKKDDIQTSASLDIGDGCIVVDAGQVYSSNPKLAEKLGISDQWKSGYETGFHGKSGTVVSMCTHKNHNGKTIQCYAVRLNFDRQIRIIGKGLKKMEESQVHSKRFDRFGGLLLRDQKMNNLIQLVMDIVKLELPKAGTLDAIAERTMKSITEQEGKEKKEKNQQKQLQVPLHFIDLLLHCTLSNLAVAFNRVSSSEYVFTSTHFSTYRSLSTVIQYSQQKGLKRCALIHEAKIKGVGGKNTQHVITSTSTAGS